MRKTIADALRSLQATPPPVGLLTREAFTETFGKADRKILTADRRVLLRVVNSSAIVRRENGGGGDGSGDGVSLVPGENPDQPEPGDDDYDAEGVSLFKISVGGQDRHGDVVDQRGWDFKNFLGNPIAPWCHDYWNPPVGKWLGISLAGDALHGRVQFTPRDMYEFGWLIGEMCKRGFLNACSAGFVPLEWSYDEQRNGYNFLRQELMEASIVPIPAHPEALIEARSAGLELRSLREWATKTIDTWKDDRQGVWLPVKRADVEAVLRTIDPKTAVVVRKDGRTCVCGIASKGVVPSNPNDKKAPEDEAWEAPGLKDFTAKGWDELDDGEKNAIAKHFAWAKESPPGKFGDLKLPHHRASDGAAVWHGVANALARLDATDIPAADKEKAKAHLEAHKKSFGKSDDEGKSVSVDAVTTAVLKKFGGAILRDKKTGDYRIATPAEVKTHGRRLKARAVIAELCTYVQKQADDEDEDRQAEELRQIAEILEAAADKLNELADEEQTEGDAEDQGEGNKDNSSMATEPPHEGEDKAFLAMLAEIEDPDADLERLFANLDLGAIERKLDERVNSAFRQLTGRID